MSKAKKAAAKSPRADGALIEAKRLYNVVAGPTGGYTKAAAIDEIATSLRKAAQGPRKWGVLR